ncbi:LGFP repeat-containing protein [Streptomyces sp. HUAS ZL42]|uniref:LGFP repeat-containing protein n=1 Tax=Streptomyces sp. HUAS ZL42 TaxID=3231715 RepID=UPI00345E4DEC
MPEVIGAIRDKWLALGGPGSVVGEPLDIERATFDGVGRAQEFAGGVISWHPELGAFATWGAICARWKEIGREQWGYLLTDELGCPDGRGRFNHYRTMQLPGRPEASVYWTPQTGAHEVFGAIRGRWSQLGWETGWLGYPTSGETDIPEGGRLATFEHGGMYWWPDAGALDLGDVAVRYRGMNCFGETDEGSGSDEPYFIVGGVGPGLQIPTFRTQVYDDVDAGGSFPDAGAEVYRGRPWGLALSVTGMEHDEGDPDVYKDLVTKGVAGAASAVGGAIAATGVGAPLAAALAPALAALVPMLANAINGLLGTGDDNLGTVAVQISAKQLCTLAGAGLQAERDIRYHIATPLISDGEASYKAYFDIVRV